jgi:hypothetical protein
LFVSVCAGDARAAFDHTPIDQILKMYVRDGKVDYKALNGEKDKLDAYVASLDKVDPADYASWDEPAKIAFWCNAYNAITLKIILEHYPITKKNFPLGVPFPVNSIRQIPGQWDKISHPVMGKPMTLNDIEHETLRKLFNEPRVHMALVCAAKGCPPLRSEAYDGARLNGQLDDQARVYFANTAAGLNVDQKAGKVAISSILNWFGEDFVKRGYNAEGPESFSGEKKAALGFVAKYAPEADREFIKQGKYKLSYLSYDWSLNDKE